MGSVTAWARVIVVNHNAGPLLQLCIDALAAQTLAEFEAVIVDNASSDGSIEALRLPDDRFRIERARANPRLRRREQSRRQELQAGLDRHAQP